MIALVILGIVITGNYDGMAWLARFTQVRANSVQLQQVVDLAAAELGGLPDNSARLADDGTTTDLNDTVTPDHCRDGANQPWTLTIGDKTYGIVYNVARDVDYAGTEIVHIYAFWNPSPTPCANAPLASSQATVDRTIIRSVQ